MDIKLENGEYIVKTIREHVFFVILTIIFYIFIAISPLIIYFIFLLSSFFIPVLFEFIKIFSILIFLYPLFLTLVTVQFASYFTFYYLHYLMITNERIIEVEQKHFFIREVSTFRLENIQDITINTEGFLASILNFGDLHLQTASKQNDFRIKNASEPEKVKLLINEYHDKVMERYNTVHKI